MKTVGKSKGLSTDVIEWIFQNSYLPLRLGGMKEKKCVIHPRTSRFNISFAECSRSLVRI